MHLICLLIVVINFVITISQNCSPGSPLLLTPLIKSDRISVARQRSLIKNLPTLSSIPESSELEMYSGFFTVRQSTNNNLFFWLIKNTSLPVDAPFAVWVNGGPGASSLLGLFVEHGPFYTDKIGSRLYSREFAWTREYNMVYVDQPAGTGFSFTNSKSGYATNEDDVTNDFLEFLSQFFVVFTELKSKPFYIFGESYAGKYLSNIVSTILENQIYEIQGLVLINPYIDPINQLRVSPLLYAIGMLDEIEKTIFEEQENLTINAINAGNYRKAFRIYDDLLNGAENNDTLFNQFTGSRTYYNFLETFDPEEYKDFYNYVERCDVRRAIHAGGGIYHGAEGGIVEHQLIPDIPKSDVDKFVQVLNKIRVLVMAGNLDIICAPITIENMLSNMIGWDDKEDYLRAERRIMRLDSSDENVDGYLTSVNEKFFYLIVRDAGHVVPFFKPEVAYEAVKSFVAKTLGQSNYLKG